MLLTELFESNKARQPSGIDHDESKQRVNEIYRVPQSWFKGGAEDLVRGVDAEKMRAYFRNTRPLPGHKPLRYNILNQGPYTEIVLIDPQVKTRPIANLTLRLKKTFPVANSYEIAVAIVDERYRGQGLIFAMYDIVLDKLQGHLVSSTTQTPGGRKIWTSLIQDPRIKVQGVAIIPTRSFTDRRLVDKTIEEIMKVGAEYLGYSTNRHYHVFAFPVESAGDELRNLIPDSKIKLYNSVSHIIKTGLMASRNKITGQRKVDDLEEGWREKTAALATAATLGYGAMHGNNNVDPATTAQSGAQHAIQKSVKPAARPFVLKFADKNPVRDYLVAQGRAAGFSDMELAHLISQVAHETMDFRHMEEIGTPKYFARKYDKKYNPRKAKILGNVKPGDGERYRGRGFVHLTGRDNYTRAGQALGIDLVNKPHLAADPRVAADIAVWFWKNRVQPKVDDFRTATVAQVTRPINPGLKGLQDREAKFQRISSR